MKKTLHLLSTAISMAVTIVCILALAAAIISFMKARKTGEAITVLGYRPVYVLTGSMEPFMKTDSIVITKQFDSNDSLREGDVVTFHIQDEGGKNLVITHRIKKIDEDGTITTKGDNNRVTDAVPITRDNIDAKVVLVCNWTASLIHMWATPKGKLILITSAAGIILLIIGLRSLLPADTGSHKIGDTENQGTGKKMLPN